MDIAIPWNISFPQSQATVKYITETSIPTGFHFVMTFQTFDIKLPSIYLVQWNEYDCSVAFIGEFDRHNKLKIFTFGYLVIGQKRKLMETEIQIHITVVIHRRIEIDLQSPIPMRIYDGPGILSPVILTEPNATRIMLSSYQGFVRYFTAFNGSTLTEYSNVNNQSYIKPHILKWFSRANIAFDSCARVNITHTTVRGSKASCGRLSVGILTIHQMLFTGYNMLSHSDDSLYSVCQYGGLFIGEIKVHPYPDGDRIINYFKICSNISRKSIFPIGRSRYANLKLHFITFQGYSSGFIDLTLAKEEDCFGENVAISMGQFCQERGWSWYEVKRHNAWRTWVDHNARRSNPKGLQTKLDRKQLTCTDVWLLLNIDAHETLLLNIDAHETLLLNIDAHETLPF